MRSLLFLLVQASLTSKAFFTSFFLWFSTMMDGYGGETRLFYNLIDRSHFSFVAFLILYLGVELNVCHFHLILSKYHNWPCRITWYDIRAEHTIATALQYKSRVGRNKQKKTIMYRSLDNIWNPWAEITPFMNFMQLTSLSSYAEWTALSNKLVSQTSSAFLYY